MIIINPQSGTVGTSTYTGADVMAAGSGRVTEGDAGTCGGGSGGGIGGVSGTGVSITILDATHVAGTFDFTPMGYTQALKGTFDLPICTQKPSLDPAWCCVP